MSPFLSATGLSHPPAYCIFRCIYPQQQFTVCQWLQCRNGWARVSWEVHHKEDQRCVCNSLIFWKLTSESSKIEKKRKLGCISFSPCLMRHAAALPLKLFSKNANSVQCSNLITAHLSFDIWLYHKIKLMHECVQYSTCCQSVYVMYVCTYY